MQNQQRTCVQLESSNTRGNHWTSTLKVQATKELKLKQEHDAIISKGDKCIWLKAIRGRDVFRKEGSLFISLCLFSSLFFFPMNTHALRDSWQSIDIRGDEVGVLRKHKHAGERRGKVTSEAYHSHGRERGEGGGGKAVHFVLWFMAHLQLCLYELLSWCLNCGNAFIRPTEQRELSSSSAPHRRGLGWCLRWKTESLFKH